MNLLLSQINRSTAEQPERAAVTFNNHSYTYKMMSEAVERMRGSLVARGVVRGDHVAILLPNSPHFVIAYFAVLGLGAVAVPINIFHKAREIAAQIDDVEATVLISWTNFSPEVEKAVASTDSVRLRIYLGDNLPEGVESFVDLMAGGEPIPADETISADDLAMVIYTSGVSGRPRGVELTHGNLAYQAEEMGRLLRVRDSDRLLGVLPFSSIMGLTMNVHLALFHGAELLAVSRFHPGDALKSLQNDQITIFVANPAMYSLMGRFPSSEKYDMSRIRFFISCESKLPDSVARDIEEKLKVRIFEGYGSNETSGMITINLFPGLVMGGSVGQPISGMEVKIVDEQAKVAPVGTVGRVIIRGQSVSRGYRNRPDKTRQTIQDGWLDSGDFGYIDYDSNLYITGHTSEMIVKGGFLVYPREVEEIVEGLPHVHEVAVVGIPDSVYGEEIKACVVLKEGATIGPAEIIEYVKERIAVYKCPKLVKFYKELPRAPGGKILRAELKEDRPTQP